MVEQNVMIQETLCYFVNFLNFSNCIIRLDFMLGNHLLRRKIDKEKKKILAELNS